MAWKIDTNSTPLWSPQFNASQCDRCDKFRSLEEAQPPKNPLYDKEFNARLWHTLQERNLNEGTVEYTVLCSDCYKSFLDWKANSP